MGGNLVGAGGRWLPHPQTQAAIPEPGRRLPQAPGQEGPLLGRGRRAAFAAGEGAHPGRAPKPRQLDQLVDMAAETVVLGVERQVVAEHGNGEVLRRKPGAMLSRPEISGMSAPEFDPVEAGAPREGGDVAYSQEMMAEGDGAERDPHRSTRSRHAAWASPSRRLMLVSSLSRSSSLLASVAASAASSVFATFRI